MEQLKENLVELFGDIHFIWLLLGFGMGLGFFNAITTLINQYTEAQGYTSDDAGLFGALLIGGGAHSSLFYVRTTPSNERLLLSHVLLTLHTFGAPSAPFLWELSAQRTAQLCSKRGRSREKEQKFARRKAKKKRCQNKGKTQLKTGIFGAVLAGAAMEITRNYKWCLRVATGFTLVIGIILATQMTKDNLTGVTICFGFFGFAAMPIVAISFESAAEITFPIAEEFSNGILMTCGNLVGIIEVLVWGAVLPDSGKHLAPLPHLQCRSLTRGPL